jgi:DNA-binding MarR family transcriptional regulator
MMWNSLGAFSHYEHLDEGQQAASRLLSSYMTDVINDAASVMLALGEKDLSLEALAARTGIENDRLERMLALLEAADYVARQNGTYAGRVLVLGAKDGEMVRDMVAMGREIISTWHEVDYDSIREALSDLTPLRSGVPFERVYTEVWHFVFAIANRELVKAGLFADPYAEGRRYKGFLPVAWTKDLSSWMD